MERLPRGRRLPRRGDGELLTSGSQRPHQFPCMRLWRSATPVSRYAAGSRRPHVVMACPLAGWCHSCAVGSSAASRPMSRKSARSAAALSRSFPAQRRSTEARPWSRSSRRRNSSARSAAAASRASAARSRISAARSRASAAAMSWLSSSARRFNVERNRRTDASLCSDASRRSSATFSRSSAAFSRQSAACSRSSAALSRASAARSRSPSRASRASNSASLASVRT